MTISPDGEFNDIVLPLKTPVGVPDLGSHAMLIIKMVG
jgi:hypothetical protein